MQEVLKGEKKWAVAQGDCIEVLRSLPDNSIDAVVTDPPYGLEFMGQEWDSFRPSEADGFRRSKNPNDAGRENVFGRLSQKAPEYKTGKDWQAGGGFSKPGIGERDTPWPSFSATSRFGAANPTCEVCGGRLRGKKKCTCPQPHDHWKPIGKRRKPENEGLPNEMTGGGMRRHLVAYQEWCYLWACEVFRVLKPGGHCLCFGGCYDEQTEVLTRRGWVPFPNATADDEYATMNPHTGSVEFLHPIEVIRQPHHGPMHHYHTNRVDLLVTPNHRMLIAPLGRIPEGRWRLVPSSSVPASCRMTKTSNGRADARHEPFTLSGVARGKNARGGGYKDLPDLSIPAEVWAAFLGLWLAEGHASRTPSRRGGWSTHVAITHFDHANVSEMASMLAPYFDVKLYPKSGRLRIDDPRLYAHLVPLGQAPTKHLPEYVKTWVPTLLRTLLDWYARGDGDSEDRIYTASKQLADDIQEIAMYAGLAADISMRPARPPKYSRAVGRTIAPRHPQYIIRLLAAQTQPEVYKSCRKKSPVKTIIDATEWRGRDVFCVELPRHHTLYVRRNGKAVWCGNTRTFHRLGCALEDAGFEVRDCILWVYGCLSEDTEILINGKWEPYHKAIKGNLALCYDMKNDVFAWSPIQERFVYDYDDTAYRIQSDHTDQIVSRNHRCLVERGGRFVFKVAEQAARQRQARVPILESLPNLLDALSQQDLWTDLRGESNHGATRKETALKTVGVEAVDVCRLQEEGLQTETKSDALSEQQRTQAVRGTRYTGTDLARITPIHYRGVVWCVHVPTGAFVARRNGKVFVTGNSGFPKSLNISKAIDKTLGVEREVVGKETVDVGMQSGHMHSARPHQMEERDKTVATSSEAKKWEGFGTSMKPAQEPIVVCRKPLSESSVAANVLKHGTGGLNIDATRIGWEGNKAPEVGTPDWGGPNKKMTVTPGQEGKTVQRTSPSPIGRWPANFALSHLPECEKIGLKRVRTQMETRGGDPDGYGIYGKNFPRGGGGQTGKGDADGMETVEKWSCPPECPVRQLDEQSGVLESGKEPKSGFVRHAREHLEGIYGGGKGLWKDEQAAGTLYGDVGGASRFFYTSKASPDERWLYCKTCGVVERRAVFKANPDCPRHGSNPKTQDLGPLFGGTQDPQCACWERAMDAHREHEVFTHPTQKPEDLMAWLVRLSTPPGGVCLDPFVGSGTTGVAALREGFRFIGIEKMPEYHKISVERITRSVPYPLYAGRAKTPDFSPGSTSRAVR